jgi:hypothetical protein
MCTVTRGDASDLNRIDHPKLNLDVPPISFLHVSPSATWRFLRVRMRPILEINLVWIPAPRYRFQILKLLTWKVSLVFNQMPMIFTVLNLFSPKLTFDLWLYLLNSNFNFFFFFWCLKKYVKIYSLMCILINLFSSLLRVWYQLGYKLIIVHAWDINVWRHSSSLPPWILVIHEPSFLSLIKRYVLFDNVYPTAPRRRSYVQQYIRLFAVE